MGTPEWAILAHYATELSIFHDRSNSPSIPDELVFFHASDLWRRLDVLSRNHEEVCREWALPTLLAQDISYPRNANTRESIVTEVATDAQSAVFSLALLAARVSYAR